MIISTYISSALKAAKRVLTLNVFGTYDPRTASECAPFGYDAVPGKKLKALFIKTTSNSEPVCAGYINDQQVATAGQVRLYSTDDTGAVQTYILLREDAKMEIGGNANHMTQFEGLQTAFNTLRGDLNSLISAYNGHTHPYVNGTTPAVTSPTSATGTPSSADITPAKLNNILTE